MCCPLQKIYLSYLILSYLKITVHCEIIVQLGYISGHIANPFSLPLLSQSFECPAPFHLMCPRINNQNVLDPLCHRATPQPGSSHEGWSRRKQEETRNSVTVGVAGSPHVRAPRKYAKKFNLSKWKAAYFLWISPLKTNIHQIKDKLCSDGVTLQYTVDLRPHCWNRFAFFLYKR